MWRENVHKDFLWSRDAITYLSIYSLFGNPEAAVGGVLQKKGAQILH